MSTHYASNTCTDVKDLADRMIYHCILFHSLPFIMSPSLCLVLLDRHLVVTVEIRCAPVFMSKSSCCFACCNICFFYLGRFLSFPYARSVHI
ncbi:hypothetical protein V8E55_008725 [Tylopilus felleus]